MSPKAEPAARRWLVRYLSEGTPSLRDVAKVTARVWPAVSRKIAEGDPELASYLRIEVRELEEG